MTKPDPPDGAEIPSEAKPADEQSKGEPEPIGEKFTTRTLLQFLFGNREAIRTAAATHQLPMLSGILVLSAAFAREYDGEDLLREPWHLLIPHAASLLTSFILYVMFALPSALWQKRLREFVPGYRTFLGLFWLTAPIAWLYAIPVEHFLSAANATRCNLWMLAIVSVWRVALIIRVIHVVYDSRLPATVVTVLLFGAAVMLTALQFFPAPILRLMGGIRLTEAEGLIQATRLILMLVGYAGLFVLGLTYLVTLVRPGIIQRFKVAQSASTQQPTISRPVWTISFSAVAIWLLVLPMSQPAQQNRRAVEVAITAGDFSTAFAYMSEREPSAFPPHWTPPPQVAFENQPCDIVDVMTTLITEEDVAPWVRDVFSQKFLRMLQEDFVNEVPSEDDRTTALLKVLLHLPANDWKHIETWHRQTIATKVRQCWNQAEKTEITNKTAVTQKRLLKQLVEQLDLAEPNDVTPAELQ